MDDATDSDANHDERQPQMGSSICACLEENLEIEQKSRVPTQTALV